MFITDLIQAKDFLDNTYPFGLDVFKAFKDLSFKKNITIIVGENGSGKSSLLELIALKAELQTIGRQDLSLEPSLAEFSEILPYFRLGWAKRTNKGFFFRAEDFFNFAEKIEALKAGLVEVKEELKQELTGDALTRASATIDSENQALKTRYGRGGLNALSHGQAFFQFCKERFTPNGIYILDEPETPFSPSMQLSLVALIYQAAKAGSQFILVTHSPILMALPGAEILKLNGTVIEKTNFEDIEHVQTMKGFLNNPKVYLDELLK